MRVRPNELANVCVLFPNLRTRRISSHDLDGYVRKGLLLDSNSSAQQVIAACVEQGLLAAEDKDYVLSDIGKELAKRQGEISPSLSAAAKDFILREMYLSVDNGNCRAFILRLKVDPVRETFIYERSDDDDHEVVNWIQLLHQVGFLDVSAEAALVRKEYLGVVNQLLMKIRSGAMIANRETDEEANEVGDFAEERAVEDEKARLKAHGYAELALLVRRISHVDRAAGYDIVSCEGSANHPEEEIFIEVKGTRMPDVCFVWTRNERAVAEIKRKSYWLYVYTNVNLETRFARGPVRISDPVYRLVKLGYVQDPVDVYVSKPRRSR